MPDSKPSIRYAISVDSLAGHIFTVSLEIDHPQSQGQKVSLPAWIPGSYMIRDFAKNIITLNVYDKLNHPVPFHKVDKQTWKIASHSGAIRVTYTIYAFDLSVRSAYLNEDFAFFNGTSVFLEVEGFSQSPCQVVLNPPQQESCKDWKVATTLPLCEGTALNQFGNYQAANYAELIDHPVLMANYQSEGFSLNNIDFELIFTLDNQIDRQRIAEDLSKLCQHHIQLFGDAPAIQRYLFITLLTSDSFGGLEHSSSTALMYNQHDLPTINQRGTMSDTYRGFLSLCSHEFFHTWHVKRIHPVELHQAPLSAEAYTEQLWIYEGFTSYYDDLSLVRSQVIEHGNYLQLMGQHLTKLHRNGGRHKQSITESSFDAWSKFYQQDASAVNNIVSYYNKGAIVALCLDLYIRDKSQHKLSLDHLMLELWQQYGLAQQPTGKHVVQDILQKLGLDLEDFLQAALYSTAELPIGQLLKTVGIDMKLRARSSNTDMGGKPADTTLSKNFGASFKPSETGVKITQVVENSPAYNARLQVGDQLISIDNWQVNADTLFAILDRYPNNHQVALHILRQGKLSELTFSIQAAPMDTIYLEISHKEKVKRWLCYTDPS
jgi:predicted metalloprotease with PDZ domain